MSDPYVRLSEAPTLRIRYPECDACLVEVESDGDGYICPSCGTNWNFSDDAGTLYPEWSGEELTGPIIDADDIAAIIRRRNQIVDERRAI